MSTSETFAQDLVNILDSSKSLDYYIHQVSLADRPSLVYSNNDTKTAQTGGGFSVLQLLSLLIVHATKVLAVDTRQDIDIIIYDAAVVSAPSLNAVSMLMYNYKAKE